MVSVILFFVPASLLIWKTYFSGIRLRAVTVALSTLFVGGIVARDPVPETDNHDWIKSLRMPDVVYVSPLPAQTMSDPAHQIHHGPTQH